MLKNKVSRKNITKYKRNIFAAEIIAVARMFAFFSVLKILTKRRFKPEDEALYSFPLSKLDG